MPGIYASTSITEGEVGELKLLLHKVLYIDFTWAFKLKEAGFEFDSVDDHFEARINRR